jgi:hypothetical protein
MTERRHSPDFDAELDATLATMTAVDDVEARSRASVLEALESGRGPAGWFTLPRLAAVTAGVALLAGVMAWGPWARSEQSRETPPLVAAKHVPATSPTAPLVTGVDTGRVEATAVAPRRRMPRAAWQRWDVEIDPLHVPALAQPDRIETERLPIGDLPLSPIQIEAIELSSVDESPSPSPHP